MNQFAITKTEWDDFGTKNISGINSCSMREASSETYPSLSGRESARVTTSCQKGDESLKLCSEIICIDEGMQLLLARFYRAEASNNVFDFVPKVRDSFF